MEKEKGPATPAAPGIPVSPAAAPEPAQPCPEEPVNYAEADVPPYEEEFTLSGGCCSGS